MKSSLAPSSLPKFLSPGRWSIAWRVRLGLIVVPLLLSALAFYQFRSADQTMEIYRGIIEDTDQVLQNSQAMIESADALENHIHELQPQPPLKGIPDSEAQEAAIRREKMLREPYNRIRADFETAYQQALRHAARKPDLQQQLKQFYDQMVKWQREVAERRIQKVVTGDQTVTMFDKWRPVDEGHSAFNQLRTAILNDRNEERVRANRFRWISSVGLLLVQGLALILAVWIGFLLARLVTAPMQQMVAQSRRIAAGDYSPTPTTRSDEFGQVIGAMNSMSAAIQARLEREILVNRIMGAITRSLNYDTVLQTTVQEIGEALGASRCFIRLFSAGPEAAEAERPEDEGAAGVAYEWTAPGITPLGLENTAPQPAFMSAMRAGQNAVSHDVATDPQLADPDSGQRDRLLSLGTRAVLAAPLILRGAITGVIGLHQCGMPRHWQPSEVDLVQHLAGQVAVALDNARLYQESTRRAADLQTARDALARSSDQLREKNQELEEFVYTVSHDLKAPLISIKGYLDVLRDDYGASLDAEAKHYIERSAVNARQLESLIADLLDLSRIGRVDAEWEEVDTGQLVQQIVDELALQAQTKNVRVELATKLPAVCCDRKRLRQILTNLIDNAIKYCDTTKPERWVRVECEESATEWRFTVRDNGIGIEPRYLEKAFRIFTRVGTSDEPGSGLGLSIVRRIAETHGGRAWAESAGSGQGSAFIFTISKTARGDACGDEADLDSVSDSVPESARHDTARHHLVGVGAPVAAVTARRAGQEAAHD